MMKTRKNHDPLPETAANYRILVQGALDTQWSEILGGMRISTRSTEGHELVTTLVGQLADQAALIGVVNTLYDLHRSILLVECLGKDVPRC